MRWNPAARHIRMHFVPSRVHRTQAGSSGEHIFDPGFVAARKIYTENMADEVSLSSRML